LIAIHDQYPINISSGQPQTSFYTTYTPCYDVCNGSYSSFNYLNNPAHVYSTDSNLSNQSSFYTNSSYVSNQSYFPTSTSSNLSSDSASSFAHQNHQLVSSIQISKVSNASNTPKLPHSSSLFKRSILSPEEQTSESVISVTNKVNEDDPVENSSKENEPVKRGRSRPKGSNKTKK
jgi:hypothetical protein